MSLLEMGIAAARAGNRTEARMLLEAATLGDPTNEEGFLWLSFVLDEPKLAMRCLERVLEINPDNEKAKRGLAWLRKQEAEKGGEMLPQRLSDAELSMMLQALKHSDEQVVIRVIRRLGEAADSRAVEPLMTLMITTKSKTIQAQARAALIVIGTPSVEPVMERLMKETNPTIASQLASVLARIHSMAALAACREVVERAAQPVARYSMAINLTASIHGEAALSIIHDYLLDARQDERARVPVATTLGQAIQRKTVDVEGGVNLLKEVKADQSLPLSVRRAALVALGISSQPFVERYLFEATRDQDVQMRVAAVDALARFTPPKIDLLDRLARSPDQVVRTRANQILDKLQPAQKR